jgi:hypothetical protein
MLCYLKTRSRDSSVGIEMGYRQDGPGSIPAASRPTPMGVERQGCEANHSRPSNAEVKKNKNGCENYLAPDSRLYRLS